MAISPTPPPAPLPPRRDDAPVRGILLICLAALCFVAMNTFVKDLSTRLPVAQIIWARYFFHLALTMALFPMRVPTLLVSQRKDLQVLRSVLILLATLCMFVALQFMPLANAAAIAFVAPLIATGLSVLVLGETVGPRRWGAVIIGFLSVLIIIRPGTGVFQWASLLPLAMATLYAFYVVITRLAADVAPPLTSLFYTALVGTVVTSIAMPFFWTWPSPTDWLFMAAAGFFGGLGHFAVIRAYERAEISSVAPFSYTELLWAALLGYIVFGDFPDSWTLIGAAIIAAAGIYVLHRERLLRQAAFRRREKDR